MNFEQENLFLHVDQADALFEKKEHLLSNLNLEELVSLSDADKTIKIESNDNETLKLSKEDGWSAVGVNEDGWSSLHVSHEEENLTLVLKGLNIEFI